MTLTRLRQLLLPAVITLLAASQGVLAQERPLVIADATLIDGTGAPAREGVTILVEDGLVTDIASADEVVVPEGATVIDAAGKYVIPGLADMHVHFGRGGGLPNDPRSVGRALRQFLFYGVTTVLNLGAYGGSPDEIVDLRRRQADGEILAPNIYATGGLLTVPGSHPIRRWAMNLPEGVDPATYDWSQRGVSVVRTPAEVREVVARMAAAGMDGIKVVIEGELLGPPPNPETPRMPPDMIHAAVEEAGTHGLPVFAHASSLDELEDAVEAGVRAVVHLVRDPEPAGPPLLAAMRERDIHYVPTLSLFIWADTWGDPSENLTDPFLRSGVEERVLDNLLDSHLASATAPSEEELEGRRRVLRALKAVHDAGVKLVGGSDTANPFVFHGYSMHHELELMVEAGLTPIEALVTATRRAAEMIKQEDVFGTIEAGKRADLLILSADPLEDIRNTRTLEVVILGGEVIERSSLLTSE